MDNENRTPQQTNIETKAVPHAGSSKVPEDVREVPYREFDNTSLPEAIAKDLVAEQLPEGVTPAALLEPTTESQSETTETKQADSEVDPTKKSKKGLVITLGAGALVVAGAVASIFGFNSASHNDGSKNEPPQSDPKATSQSPEASPSPSASTTEKELSVASIEIPANLSPEQTGEAIIDRFSEWNMAGATVENQAVYLGGNTALPTTLAGQNAELFTQALFTEGPKDDNTQKVIAYQTNSNASNIEDWFKTYHADEDSKATFPQDTEPYTRTMEVDPNGVTATPNADTTSFSITVTEHEDLKNRIGDPTSNIYESTPVEGNKFIANATTKVIDGKVKIVSIEFVNP